MVERFYFATFNNSLYQDDSNSKAKCNGQPSQGWKE